MAELVYEEIEVLSENVRSGDEFRIGGLLVKVENIKVNNNDDLIFHLEIVGATTKRRSKMLLILPKKVPVTVLK